eukprot:gene7919-9788_t
MEFYVYETRQLIKAKHRPLVFITSNNEKELPDAFLRRCFFHYIKFPDKDTMEQIVKVHYPTLKQELLATALQRSSFEPRQVQLPLQPLTRLLDHAQRLMAHLSMLRMMQLREGSELQRAQAQAAVQAAQKTLDTLLTPGQRPPGNSEVETQVEAAALDAGLDLLPEKPLSEDVLPWMNRRLQVALRDAARVASSAREALGELRRPPAPRKPNQPLADEGQFVSFN